MSVIAQRLKRERIQKAVYFVSWKSPMRNGSNQEGRLFVAIKDLPKNSKKANELSDYFLKKVKGYHPELPDNIFISNISRIA